MSLIPPIPGRSFANLGKQTVAIPRTAPDYTHCLQTRCIPTSPRLTDTTYITTTVIPMPREEAGEGVSAQRTMTLTISAPMDIR